MEIGCWEGKTSRWLLEDAMCGWSPHLTVVDTFAGGEDHAEQHVSTAGVRDRFIANVAPWRDRLRILEGTSFDVLRGLGNAEDGTFDFCYIDGSHRADDTLADAILCWPLLRPGGVLVFDDYLWTMCPEPHRRPGPAIDAFLACFNGRYHMLHKGWQVILRKCW
jgi:predicted O-methyltransferase YrrM